MHKHLFFKKITPLFLFLLASPALAQTDVGSWLVYKNRLKISEKYKVDTQYQHRSFTLNLAQDQNLITAGLSRKITPAFTVGAGYRHLNTNTFLENGMYQKAVLVSSLGQLKLTNSFMLEERWIDDHFQLRYRIGITLSRQLNEKTAVSISNQAFLTNTAGSFNQKRFIAQAAHKLSPSLRLNAGMMHWQFSQLKRWVFLCTLTHALSL